MRVDVIQVSSLFCCNQTLPVISHFRMDRAQQPVAAHLYLRHPEFVLRAVIHFVGSNIAINFHRYGLLPAACYLDVAQSIIFAKSERSRIDHPPTIIGITVVSCTLWAAALPILLLNSVGEVLFRHIIDESQTEVITIDSFP